MMRLYASAFSLADTLSDDLKHKVAQDTPTVRAKVTPSKEMFRDERDDELESGEVVRVCKSCMESGPGDGEFCPKCGDPLTSIRRMPDQYLGESIGGKYRIAEKIGQGGMGVVYLGINDDLGQKVAVKFLSRKFADDESIVLRFLNEAKSYCRVTHPNAVTLLDYGQHTDSTLYIITEFIDGLNVTETLKEKGPLNADIVLDVGIQVAEVLSAAHGQGVIHRDLKPDNIMLIPSSRGRFAVKVLDFGIAKIVDEENGPTTETGSVFGTPEFMSPEQARGDVADQRSDIYALGIILFYMLTGKLPFHGKNKLVVLNKQLNEDPPRPSKLVSYEIPPKLEAVVMKCLNKGRSGRYATADDLLEALEELRVPGGIATGKVGKGGDATELRQKTDTVKMSGALQELGDDDDSSAGFADTLAAPLDLGSGAPRLDLESIEMSREYGAETSRVTTSPDRAPILLAVGLGLAVVVGGVLLFGRSDANAARDLSAVMDKSQAIALLDTVDGMLVEGAVESARNALASTEKWADDSALPADKVALRDELNRKLTSLESQRAEFDRALASKDCVAAVRVVADIRDGSPGLADRLAPDAKACQKKPTKVPEPPREKPAPEAPAAEKQLEPKKPAAEKPDPKPVVTAKPVPVVAPGDVSSPEPDPPDGSGEERVAAEDRPDDEVVEGKEKPVENVPDGMALPPKTID